MKNEKKVIYMNQESYDKFLSDIENLRKRISKNNAGRKDAFDAGAGDGWDSPEFEDIERQEHLLLGELKQNCEMLSRIQIVEKHNDPDMIDIDDIVTADLIYDEDDIETLTFKLVGILSSAKPTMEEVSINSPLGATVYGKKIGENCSYEVNGMVVNVFIKDKLNLINENRPLSR